MTYVDRGLRNLDSQTDIAEVACSLFAFSFLLFADNSFPSDKNGTLLLVCLLRLKKCKLQVMILSQVTAYHSKYIVRDILRVYK